MSEDVECPYCGKWQEICHDDGYGYKEGQAHEQECGDCDKSFVFFTSILFYYSAQQADCLNGADHKYKATWTYPKESSMMRCEDCQYKRKPTEEEMREIMIARE